MDVVAMVLFVVARPPQYSVLLPGCYMMVACVFWVVACLGV